MFASSDRSRPRAPTLRLCARAHSSASSLVVDLRSSPWPIAPQAHCALLPHPPTPNREKIDHADRGLYGNTHTHMVGPRGRPAAPTRCTVV
eukprot:scaffold16454_cov117-Isochrysis_galbana.AAC.7